MAAQDSNDPNLPNEDELEKDKDTVETTSTNQPESCEMNSGSECTCTPICTTAIQTPEQSEQQRRNFLCVQTSLMILSVLSLASSPEDREESNLSNRGG